MNEIASPLARLQTKPMVIRPDRAPRETQVRSRSKCRFLCPSKDFSSSRSDSLHAAVRQNCSIRPSVIQKSVRTATFSKQASRSPFDGCDPLAHAFYEQLWTVPAKVGDIIISHAMRNRFEHVLEIANAMHRTGYPKVCVGVAAFTFVRALAISHISKTFFSRHKRRLALILGRLL